MLAGNPDGSAARGATQQGSADDRLQALLQQNAQPRTTDGDVLMPGMNPVVAAQIPSGQIGDGAANAATLMNVPDTQFDRAALPGSAVRGAILAGAQASGSAVRGATPTRTPDERLHAMVMEARQGVSAPGTPRGAKRSVPPAADQPATGDAVSSVARSYATQVYSMLGAEVVTLLQSLAAMIPATGDAPSVRTQPAAMSSRISSASEPNGKRSRSVTPRPRGGDSSEVDRLREELRGYERRVDELERSRHLAESVAHHVVGRHRDTEGHLAMSAASNVLLR